MNLSPGDVLEEHDVAVSAIDQRKSRALAVEASPTSVRKAVDALAIVPTKDKLTVLARKVYNVMMYQAQRQGVDRQIYRARLRDVINGIDFNSNNTEVLKEHLRQMVTTKVEWQSPSTGEGARWGVAALIAHAELSTVAGEVVMEWSYAPTIKQAILDPDRYAKISLSFQTKLKSMAGLVLYEICCRYVDNPGGVTARKPWAWWRPVLTGMPEGHGGAYDQWKYFKRDVVKGAVAEVNQVTDLLVEAIEHKRGRSMADLQFRVSRKSQHKTPLASLASPVNLRDIGRAIKCGIHQDKAERLMGKFGEQKFSDALDALEERLQRNDLDVVRSPEKFIAAILNNVVEQPPSIKPSDANKRVDKASRLALLERYREAKRKEAESLFNESTESQRADQIVEFEMRVMSAANPALQRTYRSRGLSAPMTRAIFLKFLADSQFGKGWDTPTDSELLEFSFGH